MMALGAYFTSHALSPGVAFRNTPEALTARGGLGTIDLTSMPGLTADETVTFTTLKVRFFKFKNPSTNSGPITIVDGGTNGNNLLGAAFVLVVPLGGEVSAYLKDGSQTVASGDRTLDLTGTSTDVLDVELVAG